MHHSTNRPRDTPNQRGGQFAVYDLGDDRFAIVGPSGHRVVLEKEKVPRFVGREQG